MQNDRRLTGTPLLVDALAFAAHKHRDQRRKNVAASPYINHPIALAHVLVCEGRIDDPEVLCAAILHDTVEDTQTTIDEVAQRFGERIASVVGEVTDDKSLPKARRKALQVEHAPHLSTAAMLVKLADKICNVRDVADDPPANWPVERRVGYFEWCKQVIDGLRGVHPVLEATFDEAYSRGMAALKPAPGTARAP
jgi:guanosine-3',5'-bis(diphosphate) 3'-pyrophosphohydrolase